MKDAIAGILQMLSEGAPEQRVAAAQTLAWLQPKEARVVHALSTLASEGEGYLRPYAIEALGAIGNAQALSGLIPLLHVEGPLRDRVSKVLARSGDRAEKVLAREYEEADETTKEVIIRILGRSRGAEAMRKLIAILKDPDHQNLASLAVDVLCNEIANLPEGEEGEAERAGLRKVLVQSLKRVPKSAAKDYTLHLLTLLGKVPDPDLRALLFQYSGKSKDPAIRRVALLGLKGMALTPKQQATLVSYLLSEDFHNVAGPALEALGDFVPKGASMSSMMLKLLDSPRIEVRLFAMRSLGHYETATSAKHLLPLLTTDDAKVHEIVSEALGRNKEARQGLLKMLAAARDLKEARRPMKALVALAPELSQAQVKKLVDMYMKLVKAQDPVRQILHEILSNADPDLAAPMLVQEAKKLKSAHRYQEAIQILHALTRSRSKVADEARYELAINTMLQRTAVPSMLEGDPVLGHLSTLLRSGFPLFQRIKKERLLRNEDKLYLGVKFLDRLQEEKRFGYELLEHLVQKDPESKEAVQALQKLKIEGLA